MGRLVVVTGGKGGPGATTLAVGLAGAWAAAGRSVLLVDLDPAGGDLAAHLVVGSDALRRGVAPLAALGAAGIDPEAVLAESTEVLPGMRLLVGVHRADTSGLLSPRVGTAIAQAACQAPGVELVVVDPGRLLPSSVAAAAVGLTEIAVLAVRADVPGALAAQRAFDAAGDADGLRPVAVGVRRRSAADVAELAEALGRPAAGVIPADPRGVRRALERGQPPGRGRLGRAYAALAAELAAAEGQAAPGRARRRRRGRTSPARDQGVASA
jgi:MinD-like ATPase involved in chromosome partitioning or flagellar assembly